MNIHDFAESRKCSLNRVFDFTSDANPLGPSSKAGYAARKEIGRLEIAPDEKTRYLKRYLCKADNIGEDQIVFGAGSSHLLHILLELTKPGLVGVLAPLSRRLEETLARYKTAIRLIPPDDGGGFSVGVESLCGHMGEVDMLILSNPHDMTGAVISRGDLSRLITEAARLGKVLVIDEAMRDYTDLDSPVAEAAASTSTIILRTFSVYHALRALRLGYGAGSPKLAAGIDAAGSTLTLNSLATRAALQSLKDGLRRERTLKFIALEKAYIRHKLSGLTGVTLLDTPLNFVLLLLKGEWGRLENAFLERNILIDGFTGVDGSAYIRLPVARHKSNAYFMRALRRITGG